MSLRSFHILFIVLSTMLAFGFGAWALAWHGTHRALGAISLLLGAGLVAYGVWFFRKIRSREEEERRRRRLIKPLAVGAAAWFVAARTAEACAVCYGEAEGPMIDAARLGVWLLFGLVLAVQAAFVVFFIRLRRRAREVERGQPRWAR